MTLELDSQLEVEVVIPSDEDPSNRDELGDELVGSGGLDAVALGDEDVDVAPGSGGTLEVLKGDEELTGVDDKLDHAEVNELNVDLLEDETLGGKLLESETLEGLVGNNETLVADIAVDELLGTAEIKLVVTGYVYVIPFCTTALFVILANCTFGLYVPLP